MVLKIAIAVVGLFSGFLIMFGILYILGFLSYKLGISQCDEFIYDGMLVFSILALIITASIVIYNIAKIIPI
jgi:hypothetical protein